MRKRLVQIEPKIAQFRLKSSNVANRSSAGMCWCKNMALTNGRAGQGRARQGIGIPHTWQTVQDFEVICLDVNRAQNATESSAMPGMWKKNWCHYLD